MNTKTRKGPYFAIVYTRVGNIPGAGGMYNTFALRRGRPAAKGKGTVYPSYSAAIAAAKRYTSKNGGEPGAYTAS